MTELVLIAQISPRLPGRHQRRFWYVHAGYQLQNQANRSQSERKQTPLDPPRQSGILEIRLRASMQILRRAADQNTRFLPYPLNHGTALHFTRLTSKLRLTKCSHNAA